MLGLGFGADGQGVKEIEAKGEIEGFVLTMAKVALAEDFHTDDAFAGGTHFAHDANNGSGVRIHIGADGVDSNEMNLDPGRLCGGAKCFDAVARAAVSANDAFFLGFGEDIHHAFEALGPVTFGEAVHEADIDMIGAELAAEAIEIGTSGGGIARPSFGKDGDFVARNVFESFGDVRVAAVGIGRVKETQAVVVAVEEQVREPLKAESGLMRMVAGADGAGTHGEAAGLDAGLAEGDGV